MSAVPLLLREQTFSASLPARSHDFQVRVGRPTRTALAEGPVVLTRSADREADELSLRLAAAGVPMLRLDSDRAPGVPLLWDPAHRILDTGRGPLRPTAVWTRYFTPASMPLTGDDRLDDYTRGQWAATAAALGASPDVTLINGTARPDRIGQLAAAAAVGLRTPATVVTSRPGAAAALLPGTGDLIVKSLGEHYVEPVPGQLGGLFPHRATRAALAGHDAVEVAPVIVQECVEALSELRVHVVGDRMIAFRIDAHASGAAFRDDRIGVEPVAVPASLRAPLAALVRHWALDVAAFDLLETPDGPVFLEVNVACDWLWLERRAGVRTVTTAVAELLLAAHRAGVSCGCHRAGVS